MDNGIHLDFALKAANMCDFLSEHKGEEILAPKLLAAALGLAEHYCSVGNATLSKSDCAILKKEASICADKVNMYLSLLFMKGSISSAQRDSISNTLDKLMKEIQ